MPVATFFAWILTPTTTAPVASVAVPESAAVVICACKSLTARTLKRKRNYSRTDYFPTG